ncbi:MAG: hypothetical protein AAFP13_15240 [Pseudomonadota bacterium]
MRAAAWLTFLLSVTFAISPLFTDPFTGFRADQLPIPQVNPPIQPAGYAFAIWGVIYIWLIASCGFGAIRRAENPAWHATRPWLIVSLGIGTFWIAIANASVLWATVTIWLMLASALLAFVKSPVQDRLWLRAPLGLYAGWLSAASFVSLAALMAGNDLITDGYGWALILIPAALALACTVQVTQHRAFEYGFAVSWAFVAIVVVNQGLVAVFAGIAAGVTILAALRSARA